MKPPSDVSFSDHVMPNFCMSAGVFTAKLAKLPMIQQMYASQKTTVKPSAKRLTSALSAAAPSVITTSSAT
jgi:hypothetical protein